MDPELPPFCPKCEGEEIKQMKRMTIFLVLLAIGAVFYLIGFLLVFFKIVGAIFFAISPVSYLAVPLYQCKTCGHEWKEHEFERL